LAKRGIVEDEDTNLFPVTHQMRRVENWFSSAENMIGRSRNWNRNSIKNDQAEREFRREAAKKDKRYKVNEKRRKLEAKVGGGYAKFSEKVDEENRRFDEKRDKIVDKSRKK